MSNKISFKRIDFEKFWKKDIQIPREGNNKK